MPNHVTNKLKITGKTSELNKLIKEISGEDEEGFEKEFTFYKIIPRPKKIKEDWYDWNSKNWGTKCDAYDVEILQDIPPQSIQYILDESAKGYVVINFTTAWSPPKPIICHLVKKFPSLKFEHGYIEEGNGFWAKETFKNGNLIKNSDNKNTVLKFLNNKEVLC